MTDFSVTAAALRKMAELETLILARRQASWQKMRASGEHKAIWFRVIDVQNNRIKALEREISAHLGIPGFRARRSWSK